MKLTGNVFGVKLVTNIVGTGTRTGTDTELFSMWGLLFLRPDTLLLFSFSVYMFIYIEARRSRQIQGPLTLTLAITDTQQTHLPLLPHTVFL